MRFAILMGALFILAGCSHAGHSGADTSAAGDAGENEKGAMDDPAFLPRLFGQEPAPSAPADTESEEQSAPAEGEPQED